MNSKKQAGQEPGRRFFQLKMKGARRALLYFPGIQVIRHGPMDRTVGTLGTVGNDALDSGDLLADTRDYWERSRCLGGFRPAGTHYA
ncbi:hypothetical protein J3R75_001468 [Oligosphaera ethanolica]|uniref:Uncharacterized protein n=1 Tax=Oligosphaera ethanolica TaxID=760260 RepID=A0AAE4AN92_9BACT|nr:hypothetical protein [Oligosphaera ethanolica]